MNAMGMDRYLWIDKKAKATENKEESEMRGKKNRGRKIYKEAFAVIDTASCNATTPITATITAVFLFSVMSSQEQKYLAMVKAALRQCAVT